MNDELQAINEARLIDHWETWSCATGTSNIGEPVRWIAARTRAQAKAYCDEQGWKWKEMYKFDLETTRRYVALGESPFNIDVILP